MSSLNRDEFGPTAIINKASSTASGILMFHAGLNVFLSITAALGNLLIIVALPRVSSVHPPTKLLYRCLAITDLLVGLILNPLHTIPIVAYLTEVNWKLVLYSRTIAFVFSFVLCGVSIFVSTAISVDRLLALLLGFRYRHLVTLWRVRAVVVAFFSLGVSVGLCFLFWNRRIALIISLGLVLISVIISILSYSKIFFGLRQYRVRIQDLIHAEQPRERRAPLNISLYKKTVSSIICVQLALVACYVPFVICVVTIRIKRWSGMYAHMVWLFSGTLVYLNSSLNPILYCWKLKGVRQAVKRTIRRFR